MAEILDPEIMVGDGLESMPTGKQFPPNYASNRPRYEKSRILDYIQECEEVMAQNKVETDRIRKKILCYYLTYTERQVWIQMDKYKTGTYEQFKSQVLGFHPEALRQAKGDISHLRIVCVPYVGTKRKHYDSLIEFHLKFRHEAGKLENTIVSNRELAELYLGTLDEDFRDQVLEALALENGNDKEKDLVRGAEPLKWGKYLEKAEHLANVRKQFSDGFNFERQLGSVLPKPFSFTNRATVPEAPSGPSVPKESAPPVVKKELDEDRLLQRFHSMLNEKFNEYDHKNERFFDEVRNTKDKMDIMLRNPHNFSLNQQSRPQRPPPPPMMNQSSRTPICYYCNQPGHYLNNCLARDAHLQAGKIQVRPEGLFTSDGRRLVQNEKESMREYVDKYVTGAVQNMQGMYDEDEYSRQQFNYNYAPEVESVTREEFRQLQAAIESLANKPSSSQTPLPPQTQQFVQNQEPERDSGLNQIRREQERMSRVMSQMVETLDDLKGRSQFVATRTTPSSFDEDFQED
ncbi:hypothetical protein H1R20_g2869, partial [Candolleomyces eurysporus]